MPYLCSQNVEFSLSRRVIFLALALLDLSKLFYSYIIAENVGQIAAFSDDDSFRRARMTTLCHKLDGIHKVWYLIRCTFSWIDKATAGACMQSEIANFRHVLVSRRSSLRRSFLPAKILNKCWLRKSSHGPTWPTFVSRLCSTRN